MRVLGACLAALTLLLAGLALGLASADDAGTLPAGQAGIVTARVETAPASGVPATSVATATSTDAASQIATVVGTTPAGTDTTATVVAPAPVSGPAVGNAALAPTSVKRAEVERSCKARQPPTNPLLSVGGTASGERPRSLTAFFLVIAALAAAVAGGALALRRRRTPAGETKPRTPKTPLEITAAVVAILGTLATIGVGYLGAGVKEHPPPSAKMVVREVHARITRGAYLDKMRGVTVAAPEISAAQLRTAGAATLDRLEIGDVVWLELDLTGYRDTTLDLQWALFHAGSGAALIPDTEHLGTIPVDDRGDVHSEFLPIWIGSPRVPRFRVEFRLLDDGQVRQIASTGPLEGLVYRYAC